MLMSPQNYFYPIKIDVGSNQEKDFIRLEGSHHRRVCTKAQILNAYKAENWCVGVIFDFKQDGHTIFSKFELFGFFRNQI